MDNQTDKTTEEIQPEQYSDVKVTPEVIEVTTDKQEEPALNAEVNNTTDTASKDAVTTLDAVKVDIAATVAQTEKAPVEETQEQKEANLKTKLAIIEELKQLVSKEESVNQTFQEFRDIQERWRNTGSVPAAERSNIWSTYHLHVENFYNYVKINKELRDIDLKKNLDEKEVLIKEAERLSESGDVANAFKQLQLLHSRWKEVGPVAKELKDEVWEKFKAITATINDKYHNFIENLKKEQENNLELKNQICDKAEAIANGQYDKAGAWNQASASILDLQEQWKMTGTAPQKDRNKIYKRFRSACDLFFNKKREFYSSMLGDQEKNLELKTALCEKIEAIKNSTDWKKTTNEIIALQKQWKEVGPAPRKVATKIWKRFRGACDEFFNQKAEFYKDVDSDQEQNLEKKKALIEEISKFTLSGNNDEDLESIRKFQSQWASIGFVPIKEKEALQESFRSALNVLFDKLDIPERDRNIERFKAKIGTFENGNNKDFKIVSEREKLVAKIKQLELDINTWENNMGFFSKSKNTESLINEMEDKIKQAKERLSILNDKLKEIDKMI